MSRSSKALLAISLLPIVLSGCAGSQGDPQSTNNDADRVVGTANGEPITEADVEQAVRAELRELEQRRYDVYRNALDGIATERAIQQEALARGLTREELVLAEVDARVTEPTEEQIRSYWDVNKHRADEGITLETYRDNIVELLKREQRSELDSQFVKAMRAKAGLEIYLEPPRYEVTLAEFAPTRGEETAPITFVEFGDFQCPYCRRAHPVVERLLTEHRDEIRYIFQDYPLEKHIRAAYASEAARCANDQGLFWDYYQHLMVISGDLSDRDLAKRAVESGLDVDTFKACYDSKMHSPSVAEAFDNGKAMHITGTPTFFINGRMVVGAKSYDRLKAVVEEELARAREESNVGG